MINWIKRLISYPKYKIIKEKDQFGNSRYSPLTNRGLCWFYLRWWSHHKDITIIELNPIFFDDFDEAAQVIACCQKEDERDKLREKEKSNKIEPKFKKVLTIKY